MGYVSGINTTNDDIQQKQNTGLAFCFGMVDRIGKSTGKCRIKAICRHKKICFFYAGHKRSAEQIKTDAKTSPKDAKVSIIQKDCRATAGSSVVGHAKVSNKQSKINQYLFMQLQNKRLNIIKKKTCHTSVYNQPRLFSGINSSRITDIPLRNPRQTPSHFCKSKAKNG